MKTGDSIRPFEIAVPCGCDVAFHFNLGLLGAGSGDPAHACVRCGRISCSEIRWAHVHHNTFDPYGRCDYTVSPAVEAWLDRWPRVTWARDGRGGDFLPAATRVADGSELEAALQNSRAALHAAASCQRLRLAGVPAEPPPADLPEPLAAYRLVWDLYQRLQPGSAVQTLLDHARVHHALSHPIALDRILQRDDVATLAAEAASSADPGVAAVACALVRERRSLLPAVLPAMLASVDERIGQSESPVQEASLRATLQFLTEYPDFRDQTLPVLRAAKSRLHRRAYELQRAFENAIRTLAGEPSPPVSSEPWFLRP